MLSTAWRTIDAFTCPAKILSNSRLFSLCHVSHHSYWSLDDQARRAISQRCRSNFLLRVSTDPGLREAERRAKNLRYKDERFRRRSLIYSWCLRNPWLREEQVPWKSHRPICYNQRARHYCNGCERVPTSGMKLWCVCA
jgi:hypothetical protein